MYRSVIITTLQMQFHRRLKADAIFRSQGEIIYGNNTSNRDSGQFMYNKVVALLLLLCRYMFSLFFLLFSHNCNVLALLSAKISEHYHRHFIFIFSAVKRSVNGGHRRMEMELGGMCVFESGHGQVNRSIHFCEINHSISLSIYVYLSLTLFFFSLGAAAESTSIHYVWYFNFDLNKVNHFQIHYNKNRNDVAVFLYPLITMCCCKHLFIHYISQSFANHHAEYSHAVVSLWRWHIIVFV